MDWNLPCSKETDEIKMVGMPQSHAYVWMATKSKHKCIAENITENKRRENTSV